jgi:DNA polymerase-3 subunit gamma/tau
VIEIDAASNTGVDNIRELIERSRFAPVQARWKVYVVDECHMLSTAAFNALLKTLEEPPPRVVFVLATTDPQRVLPTILSRCQRFDFRRIPLEALQGHLTWIAEQEAIGITPAALHVVAQRAQGGLRDAESLLDQLSLLPPPVEAEAVWDLLGAVPEQELLQLAAALAAADPLQLTESCRLLLERGREPTALLQGLAAVLRDLVLAGVAPDRLELTSLSPQFRTELPALARRIGKERLLHWQAQLKSSEQQLRHSSNPRLWLEVLLLGLLAQPQAAAAPAAKPAATPVTAPAPAAPMAAAAPTEATAATAPAAAAPPPAPQPVAAPPVAAPALAAPANGPEPNLAELWQQILAGLELPSTRMLLSQQAQLVRLDASRAVVRVAGTWMAMVQSRLPLLDKALTQALGSPRQLVLESGGEPPRPSPTAAPSSPPAPPTPTAPATPKPATPKPEAPSPVAASPAPAASQNPSLHAPAAPAAAQPQTPPQTPLSPQPPGLINDLDSKARRLADFFNGEVVAFEGSLDDDDGDQRSDAA